jgi:hypothetical protein
MVRNLWNSLNDFRVIPSISLGDHRFLIEDFGRIIDRMLFYTKRKK